MSAHTWEELATAAGVEPEYAEFMLWSASAFPFASPRTVFYQIQHAQRHKVCVDNPEAGCYARRAFRRSSIQRPHDSEAK